MSVLVVSAADESYALLLLDLVASLRAIERPTFGIGCLDLGLSNETLQALLFFGIDIVKPQWPFRPHPLFDERPKYLSRVIRPFLPTYFPGHETYLWLDADCWVQNGGALIDLVLAASENGLACVPAVDRAYFHSAKSRQWSHQRYQMALGKQEADELIQFNYINGGVFALQQRAPHWRAWQERFQRALDRWEGDFLSDQAILNALIYLDRMPAALLPSEYNWICHLATPMWAARKREFVSPYLPWQTLGIIHNTFDDKNIEAPIRSRAGDMFPSKLTYTAYRGLVEMPK
jgi:lipopolysaccharide biosynthesis glycosyltransferase